MCVGFHACLCVRVCGLLPEVIIPVTGTNSLFTRFVDEGFPRMLCLANYRCQIFGLIDGTLTFKNFNTVHYIYLEIMEHSNTSKYVAKYEILYDTVFV